MAEAPQESGPQAGGVGGESRVHGRGRRGRSPARIRYEETNPTIAFRLPRNHRDRLRAEARRRGITVSEHSRRIVSGKENPSVGRFHLLRVPPGRAVIMSRKGAILLVPEFHGPNLGRLSALLDALGRGGDPRSLER